MRKRIMGIVDFRERMLPQSERRFEAPALSQAPDALFVTCSDSRVVPDLLAATERAISSCATAAQLVS